MAGLNLTEASKASKVMYLPPMRRYLNDATILTKRLEKKKVEVSGKDYTAPLHIGRNLAAGLGYNENEALGDAGSQVYETSQISLKYIYSPIQVSGQVVKQTSDPAGAFIKATTSEMKRVVVDTMKSINRQLNGNGQDALAYWTSADDSSGTVVDDGRGFAHVHLPVGQTINCDLVDASDHSTLLNTGTLVVTRGTESTSPVGVNITWATGSVSGSADGDYLVHLGRLGKHLMGIQGIISASDPVGGALQGKAVASFPWFVAQVLGSDAAPTDLSFNRIQQMLSRIAQNSDASEADIKFVLCSYGVRDKLVELGRNERVAVNTMTLDGGFRAVSYNGLPWVPDVDCRKGAAFFIVPESMAFIQTADFDWLTEPGSSQIWRQKPGYDVFQASLFAYKNLGVFTRNVNGALLGISE